MKIVEKLLDLAKTIAGVAYYQLSVKEQNSRIDLDTINRIIFVAHPDDDVLFFWNVLRENRDCLVVCMTCGNRIRRQREFTRSMRDLGAQSIIWDFADGESIEFDNARAQEKILGVLKQKENWKEVFTHNKEGEYGHPQHVHVHNLVTRFVGDLEVRVPLTEDALFSESHKLADHQSKLKRDFFRSHYESQEDILTVQPKYFEYEAYKKYDQKS